MWARHSSLFHFLTFAVVVSYFLFAVTIDQGLYHQNIIVTFIPLFNEHPLCDPGDVVPDKSFYRRLRILIASISDAFLQN